MSFVRHGSRGQTLVPLFYILKKQNRVAPCPQRVPCLKIDNLRQSAGSAGDSPKTSDIFTNERSFVNQ